ncbi:hypothetical protein CVT25_003197 [Psilocybe cyanescens]|uniref:Uncharacterized protein n=1 Tax=Psilocybe cyanescens TaxID=93625 RepID=A0A409WZU7_PSICY|nr:hypothetical protein CVT25_003197 [Psilocybe cyanescens]
MSKVNPETRGRDYEPLHAPEQHIAALHERLVLSVLEGRAGAAHEAVRLVDLACEPREGYEVEEVAVGGWAKANMHTRAREENGERGREEE